MLWPDADAVALPTRRRPDSVAEATKLWTDAVAVATCYWSESRRLQLPRRHLAKEVLGDPSAVRGGVGAHMEENRGLCDLLAWLAEVLSALAGLHGPSASDRGTCARAWSQTKHCQPNR